MGKKAEIITILYFYQKGGGVEMKVLKQVMVRIGTGIGAAVLCLLFALLPSWAVLPAEATIEIEDFREKKLVFDQPADRIVCLIDRALTGFYMLGAKEKIVGVSMTAFTGSSAAYYAAMDPRIKAKTLPVVSSQTAGSLERILALTPDLVVIRVFNNDLIDALEERGIPVFGVFIENTSDIYKEIIAFGKITGFHERAETLVAFTQKEIALVREKTEVIPRRSQPNVYFMWAKGELDSGGSKSILQEILNISGAVNICGHIEQEHVVMSMENLLAADPEIIIMWHNPLYDPKDIGQKPVWKNLKAIKNNRIYEILDLFTCDLWTLNYLYSVKLMARWCHPELFRCRG